MTVTPKQERRFFAIIDGEDRQLFATRSLLIERGLLRFVEEIAAKHHCTLAHVVGKRHLKSIVTARWAVWNALHDEKGLSWPEVGAIFGRKHDSISHAGRMKDHAVEIRGRARTRYHATAADKTAETIASYLDRRGMPGLAADIRAGAWKPDAGATSRQEAFSSAEGPRVASGTVSRLEGTTTVLDANPAWRAPEKE